MKECTLVVADDHPILLSGLVEELENHEFNVIGKAKNGLEALSMIQTLNPSIAILDINMPLLDGFEVIKKSSELNLQTRFIFLTSFYEKGYIIKAKRINLSGYLIKDEPFTEVKKCIEAVLNGETYFSSKFTDIADTEISEELKKLSFLSPSERTIIRLVSQAKSSKEIGDSLSISPRTVQKHRENIANKLDLTEKGIQLTDWAKEYEEMLFNI